ncbi:heterokaryon incompatibility protein-domain-containing protein [Phaeosphaeriaceae sp. PMI808]|nr:heterokaryon incompatibility protein-domain-containing protein [Phaeosphaeriaceae sp. PMI808]
MFCETCQRFQDDISSQHAHTISSYDSLASSIEILSHEATLFTNLQQLKAASTSPCSLCRCASKSLDAHELLAFPADIVTIVILTLKQGKGSLRARFEDHSSHLDPPFVKLIRSIASYTHNISDLGKSTELSGTLDRCAELENDSTGSEASFEIARYWVNDCLKNHPECPKVTEGWLPDRVIDVGNPNGSTAPRLVDKAELLHTLTKSEQHYVALSHCWGLKEIITTKVATFEKRKRGIAMEDLSQTFRDAIIATRKLGFQFLWIDSLCIIQDSEEDWKEQSVQMCTIYQRAVFTIMAAHASGGDEGCFVERDGRAQFPFQFKFRKGGGDGDVFSACFLSLSRMSADLSFSLPLYSRAWVLQEQAISRARLIYFGEQVLWECQSGRGSERSPKGGSSISGLTDFTRAITTTGDPFSTSRNNDAKGFMESVHSQWCVLVENYMQRGITKTSDRLIAVDGLAQAIRQRTSNQYLAGLWRDQLVMGLMWYIPWDAGSTEKWIAISRKSSTFMSSRHEKPLAPSWSWAAVTYPVEWPWSHSIKQLFMDMKILCKILDAETKGTPFEQSGTVVIEGLTRKLWVDAFYSDLHFLGRETKDPKIKNWGIIYQNYQPKWAWAKCRASTKKPSSPKDFHWFSLEFHADELLDRNEEITFIALSEVPATSNPGPSFYSSRPTITTLALQPTGRPNEYRRIGFAKWRNCSWYGYYCVGNNYTPDYWDSLSTGYLVGGWRTLIKEVLEVLIILFFGMVLQQPVIQLHRDGLVWFRELASGKRWWGRHRHNDNVETLENYRRGWEPKTERLKII